jgi:hypothetical protein
MPACCAENIAGLTTLLTDIDPGSTEEVDEVVRVWKMSIQARPAQPRLVVFAGLWW